MASSDGRQRYEFDEFCDFLAGSLDIARGELQAMSGPVVTRLSLDELSLAQLVLAIQTLNPYFQIPDQMAIHEISLDDLYHYYWVMDDGHVERSDVEEEEKATNR